MYEFQFFLAIAKVLWYNKKHSGAPLKIQTERTMPS